MLLMHFTDKPDCVITRREINDEDTLICIGDGNPDKVMLDTSVHFFIDTQTHFTFNKWSKPSVINILYRSHKSNG